MTAIKRRYVHINEADRSLCVREDRAPVPGAEEVLIEVAAAGLNRADVLQRKGLYPPPADASPIMGLEVSGTVLACGEAVHDFKPGDEVCALTHGGGYASHAIAPQTQTLPVPSGYSLSEAAALPEALLTVWHNVFQRAGLKAGENVLIHGGASGIGTLGVGICKAMGATVYSTAGSADKCRRIEALGATKAFNYKEEDFVAGLDALGLKGGISVILDMVGGDYIGRNFEVAAPEGRIVNIAFLRGFNAEVNFLPMLMKRLTLTGSTLRAQSEAQKAQMVREIREQLFPHLNDGSIKVVIDKEFPLEETQAAQDYMESGVHMGKILLHP
ncbi:alcohol dehydrogenase, zinc-binding domain protein [gamma proteobacterium NOR5-3]|nr:alcohol dehydrogenase, zinc-binding domain protein [gamma proteobacterium NOR5-3]